MKITWWGHAAFKIDIKGRTLLIDPFLDKNPTSPIKAKEVSQADIVYATHDHADHLGEAIDICRRTNAIFVAVAELAGYAHENGVREVVGLNIGGSAVIKGVKLTVTQATHTASRGAPTGVIIEDESKVIYHAGDTCLFGDMRIIGERHRIDVAIIPIGGYYTMDAKEAADAVKLLNPRAVIPMHYGTMPVLAASADEFVRNVKERTPKVKTIVLKPGESYQL
jgi:L-ascorbate metabolism protein UlaG (beta-lactamase superfamily)